MNVTPEIVSKARKLAEENYSEWGQYIVECYNNDELSDDLKEYDTIKDWIKIRKQVAEVHAENDRIADMMWSY